MTFAQLLEDTARREPDKAALIDGDQAWTPLPSQEGTSARSSFFDDSTSPLIVTSPQDVGNRRLVEGPLMCRFLDAGNNEGLCTLS